MFLKRLNKNEQKYFLELAYKAANYNENFADEQELLIDAYRDEMLLSEDEYQIEDLDLDSLFKELKNSTQEIKSAIFLEIMALILSDNIYDDKEKEIISIIKNEFNITEEKYEKSIEWVKQMQKLNSEAEKLVYE